MYDGQPNVALGSSNYHLDHYGRRFNITRPDGSFAFSTCCGFGLERVAIALIVTHGPDLARMLHGGLLVGAGPSLTPRWG